MRTVFENRRSTASSGAASGAPLGARSLVIAFAALFASSILLFGASSTASAQSARGATAPSGSGGGQSFSAAELDTLVAPIALYPDALILQMVQCAASPYQVKQVNEWLAKNPDLRGTAAQDAATAEGFDVSFVSIVLFPQVLQMMAAKPDWTRDLGQAFSTDHDAVFASIQRLREQAMKVGTLASNDQQKVETVTSGGETVVVIQPTNPQVVYVPQYNPQVVYTQAAPAQASDNSGQALAAGLVGFAAGVIVGAAADDDDVHFYYASGGWGYQGAAISSGGWNDYYDHREQMARDYYDHRENMAGQAGQNQANRQAASGQNQSSRQATSGDNQAARQESRGEAQGSA